ncbi:maleylpyruvate isomerase family mycothiol-dependent enzyme [Nonomuraea aurantiaca]|uniref:maleylpyruvate isomerase family mycothiol-dependent enzyme n=1 Tax=Nonomuraea aurantiaca TaxID=2878562 RepID=UPI001CD9D909|nr:maleylpyruvate isomerase family mycothiol-dependent enzyme [Nonomuraea aurantiaca]MCA2226048.1 maleylpyruvate isomerase family mycothiol-dependent enzyme [Nonomuraea aurantiaca]
MTDIFDDLKAEYEQLDVVLAGLTPAEWSHPSAAEGWTVSDVVLHLAQTEELAAASLAGNDVTIRREPAADGAPGQESGGDASGREPARGASDREPGRGVDAAADARVAAQRGIAPADLLARWRRAAFAIPAALRAQPKGTRLSWVATPLSPATLATTRLAEHWAHANDITAPLGIPYPDTSRLRHIAWLGHRTLPYAFDVAGVEGGPVYCELTSPDGELWRFGDPAAASTVTGPAADFCRVGAHRLAPADSMLKATGPYGAQALAVLRNYAL